MSDQISLYFRFGTWLSGLHWQKPFQFSMEQLKQTSRGRCKCKKDIELVVPVQISE